MIHSELRRRPEQFGRIISTPDVMEGDAVFDGTRIPVRAVLEFRAAGFSDQHILAQYPTLTPEDLHAAR